MLPALALASAAAKTGGVLSSGMQWLVPIIIGLIGSKVRQESEGKAGQVAGGLAEVIGLGSVGGRLAGPLAKATTRGVRKVAPSTPQWIAESAGGAAATVGSFAPFMPTMAMEMAKQPMMQPGMMQQMMPQQQAPGGEIPPELMAIVAQMMQQEGLVA